MLIGVDDEGTVLGLEHDYMSLGQGNKDKFELHLRNLLNQQFGAALITTKVKISFPVVDEKEICQVDIQLAMEPLVLGIKDQ